MNKRTVDNQAIYLPCIYNGLMLLFMLSVSALAYAESDQEIGVPYIKPDGWNNKSPYIVLSSDGKRIYTVFKNSFYMFQIKPFKLLDHHEMPIDVKKHIPFDLFLTGDENYLALTMQNKVALYDLYKKKIVRSIELKDHEIIDTVLNGNELVVFTKDSNLDAYRKKHPDASRDDFMNQAGNLLIYDVYSLNLKNGAEFNIKDDSPYGVWLARLNIVDDYISLIRRQYQQYSWVFLDRDSYKPRLVFLLLAAGDIKISADMKNIYLTKLYDNIFFNPWPSYSVSADEKVSLFPAKQNVWFDLKEKLFIDAKINKEQVKELDQSPRFITPLSRHMSQAGDYIVNTGARILNTRTKQIYSLNIFDNKQAIFIERSTGFFSITEHARKHLTMKTENGDIVQINDATFNRFNLKYQ